MLLLAIRFLAELAGIAALGFIGATVPSETVLRVVLGIGLPLALIVVWGLVVAPKAHNDLPQRVRQVIGTVLLVVVGVALALAGHPLWGIALAAVAIVDQLLVLALGLDDPAATLGSIGANGGR